MKISRIIPFFLLMITILSSCKKDELITDSSAKLQFSTDSVLFDTVFHFAGSTTKVFRIYNTYDQPINISKAYLAGGTGSAFKLNIDGVSTTASAPILTDIEILGGDSLYVFVQVFVNPTGSLPLIVKDSIIFETNGNIQDVKLLAIGQDEYLHKPIPGKFYSIIGKGGKITILPNDKPHLIFGYAVVDSLGKLIIQAGTKIYMHNSAVLWVYKEGTLEILGTHGNEVRFQGDRLEAEYKDVPGQWGKIWLSQLSKNNIIDWAIIKNGQIGIQVDTVASLTNPTLRLSNTIVKNMSAAALYGQGAHIRAVNCVFANCGQYVAALTIGGKYRFEHCTFANFWDRDERNTPIIALSNYYVSGSAYIVRPLDSAYFGNCIIYGDIDEEIGIDSLSLAGPGYFSYKFDHCILKTLRNTANVHYNTVYTNNPGYRDVSINDYRLNATSFAVDKGDTGIFIPFDLNNAARPNPSTSLPDLGAFEFY